MTDRLPSPLPLFDRRLLRAAEKIVPPAQREEWRLGWQAELWHVRHPRRNHPPLSPAGAIDLSIGVMCDALWLRTESWKRSFSGTAMACLGTLAALLSLSMLIGLTLTGGWDGMRLYASAPFHWFLAEAPLVVFVRFAIESRRYFDRTSSPRKSYWIKRRTFFVAKTVLLLLLAFVLSGDICQPFHAHLPLTAELFQTFLFVALALVGLRWAFEDQQQRCKECLRSLANPERVGRPSHNFLEWNGLEQPCKQGHGLLSVPEMESSWCRSSEWMEQTPAWDRAVSL